MSSINRLVGDYTNPILQPWAAEVAKRLGEISAPEGVPFVFTNYGMQLLQQPHKITFLYPFDHQFRQVWMNRPHPAQVMPPRYGDSVGHYEGDELN